MPIINETTRAFAAWLGADVPGRMMEITAIFRREAGTEEAEMPRLLAEAYEPKRAELEQAGVDIDEIEWRFVVRAIGKLAEGNAESERE